MLIKSISPGGTRVTRILRVVLVCNTAWAIYTYRQGLICTLCAAGANVVVIAPRDRTFKLLAMMGCRCIDLPLTSKGTNPLQDLRTLWVLFCHYRNIRPHIVFHYTIKPNIYGSIAAKLVGVTSIAVTTGLGYVFIQKSHVAQIAKKLYRFAFRFPREIWFLNRDDEATFLEQKLLVYPERAKLLRSEGIDLDQFPFTPLIQHDDFVFVLIGRLLWEKGVSEYVEAARQLRISYPQAHFRLLGPINVDNLRAISRSEIAAWEREGIIEYLGETHDVRPFIADADCIVLPSYREGVPRILIEASAMGRPIVATDVPGCREVVTEGVNGLLCKAYSVKSLVVKLSEMLELDIEVRRSMGKRGRQKVATKFDERLIIERYKDLVYNITGILL